MSNMTISDAAQMLADAMDRPMADILVKLEQYVNEGLTLNGAVARFKSENKFQLGAGRVDIIARFISLEPARPVTLNQQPDEVSNIHFAVFRPDKNDFTFLSSTVWTKARIDEFKTLFEKGRAYKFKASTMTRDGQATLSRISKVELLADQNSVPTIEQIQVCPISGVTQAIGKNELVKGTIGKIIVSGGKNIGFELSDMSPSPPLTIWYGGQYSKLTPEEIQECSGLLRNDEVIVFGNLKQGSSDIAMNAISVMRAV